LLPAALELTAYRVIQEALTNALKYSRFAPTQVVIEYRPHEVALEVLCNGPVKPPSVSGGGRGLAGMKDRVAIVGGRLEAGPDDDQGFNVRAWLPTDPPLGGDHTA
jgi:signal transduction histidine kinase